MKRIFLFFGIITIAVFALGVAFGPASSALAFAQNTEIDEQERIEELHAILSELILLVVQLQQQLLAIIQAQTLATTLACAQAEIVWEKVSGATDYVLYRNNREVYSGGNLKFIDTGLIPGVQYAYTVRARNAGGLGPASSVQLVTTPFQCPPSRPFVWAQEGACGGSIRVSWNLVQEANFYEVFRGETRVFGGISTFFLDQGLRAGRNYTYTVRAGNTGGLGEFSQEVKRKASGVCPPAVPKAPKTPKVGTPFLNERDAEEGVLTFSISRSPSGVSVQSGHSANILSFVAAAKFSKISLERLDVEFLDRPWIFISEVELRDGGHTVLKIEALEDAFVQIDDNKWRLRFSGLAIKIPKGGSKTLSVHIATREGLLLKDPRRLTVSIPVNSVFGKDEIGISLFGPSTNNFLKTFFVTRKE